MCCCHMIATCLQAHRVWISMAQCLLLRFKQPFSRLTCKKCCLRWMFAHMQIGNDRNVFMFERNAGSNFACMRGLWWVCTCCGRVIDSYRTLLRTSACGRVFAKIAWRIRCILIYMKSLVDTHTHTTCAAWTLLRSMQRAALR